jgi:hypothetical protein
MLKPPKAGALSVDEIDDPLSVEELEVAVSTANDKERLIGLVTAPFAALISLITVFSKINNDPAARLKSGQINPLHTSTTVYEELLLLLVVMSILILVLSLLRKRLFLGIVVALYGLAVFNLKFYGFGVPFIMVGAWLLVRAYRLQRNLKEATGELPGGYGGSRRAGRNSGISGPSANKRYTPPTSARR